MNAQLIKIRENHSGNALIFIHGLNGDPISTWKDKEASEGLIDAVCKDSTLSKFDIYSFGYRTGTTFGQYDFITCANLLFSEIRANLSGSNISFITHSMGGLVAGQYIINRYEDFDENNLKRIKGVVFFGVPFKGSFWAKLGSFIPNKQIKSLISHSPQLEELKKKWHKYVLRGGIELLPDHLKHEFKTLLIYGSRDNVVSEQSSNPLHMEGDKYELDGTHTSICKGDSQSTAFKHLQNMLLKLIEDGGNNQGVERNYNKSLTEILPLFLEETIELEKKYNKLGVKFSSVKMINNELNKMIVGLELAVKEREQLILNHIKDKTEREIIKDMFETGDYHTDDDPYDLYATNEFGDYLREKKYNISGINDRLYNYIDSLPDVNIKAKLEEVANEFKLVSGLLAIDLSVHQSELEMLLESYEEINQKGKTGVAEYKLTKIKNLSGNIRDISLKKKRAWISIISRSDGLLIDLKKIKYSLESGKI